MMTVEQHDKIRQLFHNEHLSARQVATRLGISRNTVAKALKTELAPTYLLQNPRPSPKLGDFKSRIDQLLLENRRLPRKQRFTSHRIFETIQQEGYTGSYSSVNLYTVEWRKNNHPPKLFIPLAFQPGQDAQVDWGEAEAIIAGVRQTVQVFVMWLAFSRRIFVMAFPSQKQEAFFLGHVEAFLFFGGVPHRISYDNLSAAVKILTEGRIREENRSFVAFRAYHLFESHFCTPGQGHEKGGVEGSVGFSRRNFMVPIPQATSFAQLNAYLLERCLANDARTVSGQSQPIGVMWEQERPLLSPLPARPFECCVSREATLNGYSQVTFETNRYSVPVDQARRELVIKAYPFRVDIFQPYSQVQQQPKLIASHPRCYGQDQDIFDPLHYLGLLEQRPGAFEYARPLAQWKKQWPPVYHQVLSLLTTDPKWPGSRGIKEFVRILKLHSTYSAQQIEQALGQALRYNCVHFDGVQQCLHHQAQPQKLHQLSFLDLSEYPQLAAINNQPVDLSRYNALLSSAGADAGRTTKAKAVVR